nr:MAG TPA: hypothetical protein [Bacteriophage sp.]
MSTVLYESVLHSRHCLVMRSEINQENNDTAAVIPF